MVDGGIPWEMYNTAHDVMCTVHFFRFTFIHWKFFTVISYHLILAWSVHCKWRRCRGCLYFRTSGWRYTPIILTNHIHCFIPTLNDLRDIVIYFTVYDLSSYAWVCLSFKVVQRDMPCPGAAAINTSISVWGIVRRMITAAVTEPPYWQMPTLEVSYLPFSKSFGWGF